jgi:hypothetical protein
MAGSIEQKEKRVEELGGEENGDAKSNAHLSLAGGISWHHGNGRGQ